MTGTAAPRTSAWTIEAARGLGTTTDVETASAVLGIGRTKRYELARSGPFPVAVIHVGHRCSSPYRLLALLGAGTQ